MNRSAGRINIVVPIYEMAGELGRLETWIQGIKSNNFRIYLIDDFTEKSSTDEIVSMISRCGHLEIKLLSNRYESPGAARNAGLKEITDGWIAFWDADDSPAPERYEEAISETNPDIGIIIGRYESQTYDSDIQYPTTFNSRPPNWLNVIANPGIWRCIFRREIIGETKFPTYRLGEDQIFLADVLSKNPKVQFSKHCFYVYTTGRVNSLTNSRRYDRARELSFAKKNMRELINKNSKFRIVVLFLYLRMTLTLAKEKIQNYEF